MVFKKISSFILSIFILSSGTDIYAVKADKNVGNCQELKSISEKDIVEKKIIDVPYINQDKIVYGCEAVSSTMLLKYYGYDINEKDFTDNYLIKKDWYIEDETIYGPDPNAAFPGDPYKSGGVNCGFGSYALSTAKSINKVLDNEKHQAVVKIGLDLSEIVDNYIKNDIPVLIWATMDMKQSRKTRTWTMNYVDENSNLKIGDRFTWIASEHCLVLVGYDDKNYYFNDPYKNHGLIAYEKSLVEKRYKELGKQCVYIEDVENLEELNTPEV